MRSVKYYAKWILIKLLNRWSALKVYMFKWIYFEGVAGLHISSSVEVKHPENMIVGKNCRIGPFVTLGAYASILIEDNVTISKGALIETGGLNLGSNFERHIGKAIILKESCWIGANSIILPGVTIGKNTVVGAGSVVTKSLGDNLIIAGNPAKEIKKRI